ncbi:hypothetical protein [Deinococcus yavapaiensis]|uniref:Uncharacterized protein n=1 Tax=Deinococcus yavapaiensis KR-236 TaxID=694435 RepID=A0A318S6E9_9DEIO|nr:hypothetical protein [Deinococcus yavapaiensis]PYE53297.1 hypothetical protein DES52_10969 [Deinococcus yavapaiensis KR-236]
MITVIQDALASKELYIVRAPPGGGKSKYMRKAVQHYFQTSTISRVLWATQDTVEDTSLGAECERYLREDGVSVVRVLGKKHFGIKSTQKRPPKNAQSRYEAQFKWPAGQPHVKIVSHAHLPLIYAASPTQEMACLRQAQLLICDEDPINALLHVNDLWENEVHVSLTTLKTGQLALDNVSKAVQKLLTLAKKGGLRSLADELDNRITRRSTFSLTRDAFWQALRAELPVPDWQGFADTLRALGVPDASILAAEMRTDFERRPDSARVGLYWIEGIDESKFVFRFAVRRILHDLPPTIILDAYADQNLYQALFAEHTRHFRSYGAAPRLVIEVTRDLAFDRQDLKGDKKPQRYLHIAEELFELCRTSSKGVLLLTDKTTATSGPTWRKARERAALFYPGVAERLKQTHWFGKRGLNEWDGFDVVATTLPKRPRFFALHALAALYPMDAIQRREAARKLEINEALQLLNRGRQLNYANNAKDRPRIIVAFDEEWMHDPAIVDIRQYQPTLRFKSGVHEPRWCDAVRHLAPELEALLGCAPLLAWQALGLLKGNAKPEIVQAAARRLRFLARPASKYPWLVSWKNDGDAYRWRDVMPAGHHMRKVYLESLMSKHGWEKFENLTNVKSSVSTRRQVVYAPSREAAQQALDALLGK